MCMRKSVIWQNKTFVKCLHFNNQYSAIFHMKVTYLGGAIVAVPGYHIQFATCTKWLKYEHLNLICWLM